jgi:hypothetical protein
MQLKQAVEMFTQMAVSYGTFNFPPNPDIAGLLQQAAAETDPVLKAQLTAQAYAVTAPLTDEEKSIFGYLQNDYIENNPGLVDNRQTSYVGISGIDDIAE